MAHNLEINAAGEGQMFSVKKRPWHELGTILDSPPSIVEGIKMAGLDWEVKTKPLFTYDDDMMPIDVPANAVIRTSNNAVLGVVGKGYTPLQNIEAFNFFNPFLESGVASLESAGSLFDGKKVWVLAKVNSPNIAVGKSDEIEKFILLSNSHDGTTAVKLGFTPVRVVCNNTLTAAQESGASSLIRVFHRKKVAETVELVRQTMNIIEQSFSATEDQFKAMARRGVSEDDLRKYIKVVLRPYQSEESKKDQDVKVMSRITDNVISLFESGQGADLKTAKGTVWGAYNAVIEYLQYQKGKDPNQRFNRLWFSSGGQEHRRAYAEAVKLAA